MTYFDYRQFEADADQLQKVADPLIAKRDRSPEERDTLMSLQGQIQALDAAASRVKTAELAEMRASIARGDARIVGEGYGSGDVTAFYDFIRTTNPQNLSTGDTGAYVVPAPILAPIQEAARALSPITAFAYHLDLSGGAPEAELPLKTHGVAAHATELGTRSEQTAATFASVNVVARDIYSDQRPSSTWLDSVPGAPDMLTRWLVEDLYETLEEDVAVGAGTDRANGLFAATGVYDVVPSGASDALANTLPMAMITALQSRYLPGAVFLCNPATLGVLSAFTMPSAADAPLISWDGGKPTMYGFPVLTQTSAPAIGNGAHPLALANLPNAYLLASHRPPGILIDPYTVSSSGKIRYLASMRVGGTPWNPGACVLGKSDTA